jgi:hypothetical protein
MVKVEPRPVALTWEGAPLNNRCEFIALLGGAASDKYGHPRHKNLSCGLFL